MNDGKNFNWQVRTAALTIFLLGFVAGALFLNIYQNWFGGAAPATRQQRYEKIFNELSLSEAQRTDVDKIVGDARAEIDVLRKESEPKYLEIRNRYDEKFKEAMTPEQWSKFEDLRKKLRESEKSK